MSIFEQAICHILNFHKEVFILATLRYVIHGPDGRTEITRKALGIKSPVTHRFLAMNILCHHKY